MNLICQNILKALCGDYVGVDLETTALNPKDGVIISMGFVPFSISLVPETLKPVLAIHHEHILEDWYGPTNAHALIAGFGNSETIDWHLNKNEAFQYYEGLAIKAGIPDLDKTHKAFLTFFKEKNFNFLSRHSFDANWLAEKSKTFFDTIHYRNFVDIAKILKGTGITDNVLYRTLEARAVDRAKEYQTSLLPGYLIPKPEVFVKHRAISDCFIAMFFLYEVAMYIWRNAKTNVEI